MSPPPPRSTLANKLLAALEPEVQERVFPHLHLIDLPLGEVIYEAGHELEYVYFPTDCIVSLLYGMENGDSAEISVVGNEGLIGISMLMGGNSTPSRALVQSGGSAYRIPSSVLQREFHRREGNMQLIMLRYTQALITEMVQTAACNRHHTIDQQLCRWLLLALDRLPRNHFDMSQELIAHMLGARREEVAEAVGKLEKAGAIEYRRGHITVTDRLEIEKLCCECYAVVRKESDRLLPGQPLLVAAN